MKKHNDKGTIKMGQNMSSLQSWQIIPTILLAM